VAGRTYHALGLDLSALEVFDRPREAVSLRKGPNDLSVVSSANRARIVVAYPDFVAKNLGWWPRDTSLILVNAVNEERPPSSDVVDGILDDGLNSSRLHDDVESERVVLLQFIPLRFGVLPEHR